MIPYNTYTVFLGNNDKALATLVTKTLHEVLGKDFAVKVSVHNHINDLTRCTQYRYDLWILVLHGIIVPSSESKTSVFSHVDPILDVIATLKAKHRTPVIALSSFIKPELPERARYAGTDFYFELPFNPERFKKAILKCVKVSTPTPRAPTQRRQGGGVGNFGTSQEKPRPPFRTLRNALQAQEEAKARGQQG